MDEQGSVPGKTGDDDEAAVSELFARLPDTAARDGLAERFHPLARYLARKFAGRGEQLDDLEQVASIGLINAIDRFDPERGVRFSTYAAATIVGELKRHFRDKGWAMRVPRPLQELAGRMNEALPALAQRLGRSPTIAELAVDLGVTPENVAEAMEAADSYALPSLDAPTSPEGTPVADRIGDPDPTMELLDEWVSIAPAVADLPERARRVLYLRFIRGMTQSEIAAQIGVSQMHVSRILSRTLDTLRELVANEHP
jgi:RNA polymerase sigma-B factor